MSAYIASAERWYRAGKSCAEVAVWTLSGHASGNSGSGSCDELAIRPSSSSTSHGIRRRRSSTQVEAAPSSRVGRRLDSVQRLEHRLADRLAELVAALEAVPARLAVAEPVVPGGDVAGAALEEDALDSRHAGLDRLAQRAGEVRVPEQRLAADQRRMAREARDDGDRLPSSPSTRSTGTLSSTGRSRRTLLTLIPGARPVPQPTRAGRRPRQAA